MRSDDKKGHRLPDLRDRGQDPGTNLFQREGEYWTIAYEGTLIRLRDTKGMRALADLLNRPGARVLARDLILVSEPSSPHALTPSRLQALRP